MGPAETAEGGRCGDREDDIQTGPVYLGMSESHRKACSLRLEKAGVSVKEEKASPIRQRSQKRQGFRGG